ncbi:type VI secretion system baseplate subunit TssF [Sphingomonas sp. ASY06-1R]|uniref:type VI secretion system baseplate subunit TssF n=1 Tax=Sphingomonas sp. ASY06-1R TaxID=3445771 RepID=UPI003FA22B5C
MDPRFLQAYNDELVHLRETARQFGEEYPTVAGRLGLGTTADVDPHVERLLEGVAFLGARVQLKLQDQFPDFTQHLLNVVQPHYLAPTPSICVVGFEPLEGDSTLAKGVDIPRETRLHATAADRDASPVIFRTGHDVTLWPIQVEQVEYLGSRSAVAPYLGSAKAGEAVEAGLRIRLRTTSGIKFGAVAADSLPLYLDGEGAVPGELYRQLIGDAVGAVALAPSAVNGAGTRLPLPAQHGFDEACALLPAERRSNRGYRILSEYFACPERFQFVRIDGLARAFAALDADEGCDIVILFRRVVPALAGAVSTANVRLFATPAINLFEKQLDRVQINAFDHERQVIADRARPLDFEVYRLLDVKAHGGESSEARPVAPLYDYAGQLYDWGEALFFVTRMRHRRLSTREQRMRQRSDYIGTETWISLTAPGSPERIEHISELSVRALVTNRELAGMIRTTGTPIVAEGVPIRAIALLRAPTRPRPPLAIGDSAWRLIAHLTPNYTGFARDPGGSPEVLRSHLALYGRVDDAALRREVDGIRAVHASPVSRRLPDSTRVNFVRGQHLRIVLDQANYENGRMFLFSAVVERFLAEFAAVNSFAEVSFETLQQGMFAEWPARLGQRPTI